MAEKVKHTREEFIQLAMRNRGIPTLEDFEAWLMANNLSIQPCNCEKYKELSGHDCGGWMID
jgi:hypothetical protein